MRRIAIDCTAARVALRSTRSGAGELQKKAPNVLNSLDAEMESPGLENSLGRIEGSAPFTLRLCPEDSFAFVQKNEIDATAFPGHSNDLDRFRRRSKLNAPYPSWPGSYGGFFVNRARRFFSARRGGDGGKWLEDRSRPSISRAARDVGE